MGLSFSQPKPSTTSATFTNPVVNSDFPDPNCIKVKDTFYAFATNFGELQATTSHIQLATSTDLVNFKIQPDALPELPKWAKAGRTWAPNVTHVQENGTDTFVLYFVAWDVESDLEAIGIATSKNPEGPYKCDAARPSILQADQGGSIDPSVFTDYDGNKWLLFKNDGNRVGQVSYIYLCPLTSDALQLAGKPEPIIKNDQPWEGAVVEAPFMWKHDGRYYLFYSGNAYASPEYAVGYAVADMVTGPYHKSSKTVIKSEGAVIGPGACCIVKGPKDTEWMLYHSWDSERKYRATSIAEVKWQGKEPVVKPTWGKPQPAPYG